MKKFLRVLSVTLALAMVLVASVLGVMATVESTAVVYGDRVNLSGNTTSTFDVGFHFKENNTAIEVGKINLSWNAQKITATQIVAAGALTAEGVDFVSTIDNENGKATVAWVGSSIGSDVASGDLFNVTFDKSNLSEEDIVSIAVEVESLGYSALFVPYNVAETVTASAAVATSGEVGAYTGSTEEDAIAWINSLIAAAEFGDVEAKIASDLEFTSGAEYTKINFGTSGSVPTGTISFSSEGTDANGKPFGFVVDANTILNFYANLAFNNVKLDGTDAWTSGGCIQVTEGSAIYGVNDEGQNYGNIYVPSNKDRMNIAGADLEVYSGKYRAVCGNYYNTGLTVDTPSITVGGNTSGQYIIGSSHNGKNTVTGISTVVVEGSATFTNVIGGSWCSSGVGANGGTLTVNGNPTISYLIASCVGDMPKVNLEQYVMTINGGTISTVANHMFTSIGTATINAKTTLNSGTVTSGLYGGSVSNWNTYGGNYQKDNTTNKLYGTTELIVKTTPGCITYGGSYMAVPDSVHAATSTLTFDGVTLNKAFYGGSNLTRLNSSQNADGTYKYWKKYKDGYYNSTECKHTGDTVLNLKNGTVLISPTYNPDDPDHDNDAIFNYCGSYMSSLNSVHSGSMTINMFKDEGNTADYSFTTYNTFYGGSDLVETGASHTGRIKMNIDSANIKTVSTMSFGLGGVRLSNANAIVDIPNEVDENGNILSRGIEISISNSTIQKRIFTAGWVSVANELKADALLTIGAGNTTTADIYGSGYPSVSGAKIVGNSKIVIDAGTSVIESPVYGGGYLVAAGGTHKGSSTVEVLSGTINDHVYGGSNITTASEHEGDSHVIFGGGSVNKDKNVFGGSLMTNGVHTGNSKITVDGTTVNNTVYGGSRATSSSSGHVGDSAVEILSGAAKGTIYGGSYLGTNRQHKGNSHVDLQGGTHSWEIYGGSFCTASGSNHTGNSKVTVNGMTIKYSVFGGSRLYVPKTNHFGNSEVVVNSGEIQFVNAEYAVYGGSDFPVWSQDGKNATYSDTIYYGHIGDSGIVFNSGTCTSGYLFGGSDFNVDGDSVAKGYAVHGIKYQAANGETPEVKASKSYVTFNGGSFTGTAIYGGAYLNVANTSMNGDVEVTFNAGTIKISDRIAAVYTNGGNNYFYGNSIVKIAGSTTVTYNVNNTSKYVCGVMGGLYGPGIMYGDSTLEFSGNSVINYNASAYVIAGCVGTNDVSTEAGSLTVPYGGIRQYGDVTFIAAGTSTCKIYTHVSGYRSNVQGDVIIDISETPTFTYYLYGLSRHSNKTQYSSCTGDINMYVSGSPKFSWGVFVAGGQSSSTGTKPNDGINICGGRAYLEISGTPRFTCTNATNEAASFYMGTYQQPRNSVIKLVGNAKVNFTDSTNEIRKLFFARSGLAGTRVLDLTQFTGEVGENGYPTWIAAKLKDTTSTFTTRKTINGSTFDFDASSLNVGDAFSSIIADEYTYNGQTMTYENITQYDSVSRFPNAFKFYSEATGKEIKNLEFATSNVIVKCGDIQIGKIVIEAKGNAVAEEKFAINSNFMFKGNSFRMSNPSKGRTLALRCRAYVDPAFLKEYATIKDGFMISEIGMLVSVKSVYGEEEMVYGGAGVSKAVAYKDGDCAIEGGWKEEDGKLYYNAAITGYEDENGLIANRVIASIYTRAYIVYADANGDTLVYYYDLPESASAGTIISGEGFDQYRTSLYDRVDYEKKNNTGDYVNYKTKFEEILACKNA